MLLAVDQSLSGTGICLLSLDGNTLSYGIVTTTPKQNWEERMDAIVQAIDKACEQGKDLPGPHYFILESYAYAGNVQFTLGELGGILKYHMYKKGFNVVTLHAAHNKMFTARDGKADKKAMVRAANAKYGALTTNHNIADAISLAKTFQWYLSGVNADTYETLLRKKVEVYLGDKRNGQIERGSPAGSEARSADNPKPICRNRKNRKQSDGDRPGDRPLI